MIEPFMSADTAVLVGRGISLFCAVMVIVCAVGITVAVRQRLPVVAASMSISMLAMTITGVSTWVSATNLERILAFG